MKYIKKFQVRAEIDVHELLAQHQQVAVIWSIEDVQNVRPKLSDERACQVLQDCISNHDCEEGFHWHFIEQTADTLFPESGNAAEEGDRS
jgi:hypothetical protein